MFINPYLNFNGNTEQAFNFYKSIFGGDFPMLMRFKDTPGCEDMPEVEQNHVMHVALPVGSSMLMGTDVPASMPQVTFGSAVSLCVSVDSREDADRIFSALSDGAKIEMPMDDMFWGDYFGHLTDKFGISWMISYDEKRRQQEN